MVIALSVATTLPPKRKIVLLKPWFLLKSSSLLGSRYLRPDYQSRSLAKCLISASILSPFISLVLDP